MKVRTMKKFTCDAKVREALKKHKATTADAEHTRVPNATKPAIDLNEIHRRFWARQAGKE